MRRFGQLGGEIVDQTQVHVEIPGFDDSIRFDLRHPQMPQKTLDAVRRCYGLRRIHWSYFFRSRKVRLSRNESERVVTSCFLPAHCHFVTPNGLRIVPQGMPELVLFMEHQEPSRGRSWERFFKIPKDLRGLVGELFGNVIPWDGSPVRFEDRRRIFFT